MLIQFHTRIGPQAECDMRTKLIVALLVTWTLAIAVSAGVKPIFRGKFSLPYEVHC